MNYLRLFFCIVLPTFTAAFLNYDRAIIAGQKNNWATSSELLKKELVQNPESPELLYDTGVSSYKNGDYEYALSYFIKAAESSSASQSLQEQALFNAGNSQVALKQLENALATFDKVLKRNPQNAKAAHNKEMVKKMLEEQKKQQQQNQNKEKNKNEKDTKEQHQQDEQSQENNKQKENTEQNNKEQNQDSEPSKKENQSDNQKKNDTQEKQKKEQELRSEQEKQSQKDKQTVDQQKKDELQKSDSQNTQQSSKEEQSNPEQQLTPSMARMLDEREKKDAQLNKQLMRAMAGAQNGADHNEHYW